MAKVVRLERAQEFRPLECGECGIWFAIEASLMQKWVDTKHSFYCPNGHSRRFIGETEAERIKRELSAQLDAAKRDAEWSRVREGNIRKRLIAQKGQITKLRKRVANGVCPCCHRTFGQLARHMKLMHPNYERESAMSDAAVDRAEGITTD